MKKKLEDIFPFTEEELLALKNFYSKYEEELREIAKEVAHYIFNSPLGQKIYKKFKRSLPEVEASLQYAVKSFFTQEEEFFWRYGIFHYEVAASEEGFSIVLESLLLLISRINAFIEEKLKEDEGDSILIRAKDKATINYIFKCGKSYIPLWLEEHQKLFFTSQYLYDFLSNVIDDLNEALSFQKSFLAGISHEIRTPLNAILGYLRLLEKEKGLSSEGREFVRHALESTDVLLRLINDLLDASKLQAGKMEVLAQPLNITQTICEVIELFKQPREKVAFKWKIDYFPYYLIGDRERIKQIVSNLLSNAFKFTKEGFVDLSLRVIDKGEKAEVMIMVEDTGVGIPEDKARHLFQPFKQVVASASGTGLGLYISRELARKMGGDIWFESEPGKGTIFYAQLVLPKGKRIEVPKELKETKFLFLVEKEPCHALYTFFKENQIFYKLARGFEEFKKLCKETEFHFFILCYSALKRVLEDEGEEALRFIEGLKGTKVLVHNLWWEKIPEEMERIVSKKVEVPIEPEGFVRGLLRHVQEEKEEEVKKVRVLVVDDLKTNCDVAKATLEKFFGACVDTALSAKEAFELVKKNYYDLIFLDLKMPELDGFSAVKKLREMGVKVPIIALSAEAFKETIEKAFSCGFDDYITKPFTLSSLRGILEKYARG